MPAVYIGIFLTNESREKLLKEITPVHPKVYADHVTLIFKPDDKTVQEFLPYIGETIPIYALEEIADRKGQAVVVALVGDHPFFKQQHHITISTIVETPPSYSNKLHEKASLSLGNKGPDINIRLTGIIDFFPRTIP